MQLLQCSLEQVMQCSCYKSVATTQIGTVAINQLLQCSLEQVMQCSCCKSVPTTQFGTVAPNQLLQCSMEQVLQITCCSAVAANEFETVVAVQLLQISLDLCRFVEHHQSGWVTLKSEASCSSSMVALSEDTCPGLQREVFECQSLLSFTSTA